MLIHSTKHTVYGTCRSRSDRYSGLVPVLALILAGLFTAASSTVGLYFDEVAIPYAVMSRGVVFDVQRVEVLKGPQGDLYGRNTTAGQINFVSNKPTGEFEAGFHGSYGRFGVFDLEGFASGGLGDQVQARLAFRTTQSSKGWQQSTTRDDTLGELNSNAVRALFNLQTSDRVNLLLNLHYVQDQSDNRANTAYDGTIAGLAPFSLPYTPLDQYFLPTGTHFGEVPPWYSTGDNRAADWTNSYTSPITGNTFDLRPRRDNELKGVSAKLEWDLGNMDLTSILTSVELGVKATLLEGRMQYLVQFESIGPGRPLAIDA